MERQQFIKIIENIISEPENYFKINSSSAGKCHLNFSFVSFKTQNNDLFDLLKNYFSSKDITFYNSMSKDNQYSFWEKAEKLSDSDSFLTKIKNRSQRHFLTHMINAADEFCLINHVEKEYYMKQIQEKFKPQNPINWVKEKAQSLVRRNRI